jgi:hypothetical protein
MGDRKQAGVHSMGGADRRGTAQPYESQAGVPTQERRKGPAYRGTTYDPFMKNSEVPREAIRRAVQVCGGIDTLSDALSVSAADIERWISGEKETPLPMFIQAVGLLLEATSRRPPGRSGDPTEGSRKERKH